MQVFNDLEKNPRAEPSRHLLANIYAYGLGQGSVKKS